MTESPTVMKVITGAKDPNGNSISTISNFGRGIHEGICYNACLTNSAVAASSWINIQMNCDSTSDTIHLKEIYFHNSGGIAQVHILEQITGSTMTNGSSSISIWNRNRNSTNVSTVTLYGDPTNVSINSSEVNILECVYIGSTMTGAEKSGASNTGIVKPETELLLRKNTTTILRITNLTTNASYSSMQILWYEG